MTGESRTAQALDAVARAPHPRAREDAAPESVTRVDVTGEGMTLREHAVHLGNRQVHYLVDENLKSRTAFHLGAFFSKSVFSDDVFRYPRSRRVAVLTESPIDKSYREIGEVTRRFPVIFTHQQALIASGVPFRPLMFGTNWLGVGDADASGAALQSHPEKTGMVSFMGSVQHADDGAYRFRREVAELAMRRGDVECFGKGIRAVPGKRDAIAPFRFSIAMENAAVDHYFSEKLIDCLLVDTVPIYYGCPGIGDLFDSRGLLTFTSCEQLADILGSLTTERYERMLPFALANKRKAIAERWHNHAGLLERVAEALPAEMLACSRAPISRGSRLHRVGRKMWERIG